MPVNETQNTQGVVIPDKMYFKIGEVSQITGVKPYILRYWETEFPIINPAKRKNKHRLYRRKDVEDILLIKKLLYEQKYTIAGARMKLKERHRMSGETNNTASTINTADLPTMTDTESTVGEYSESTIGGMTTTTDLQLTTLEEFANNPGSQQAVQEVLKELESIKELLEL
jgi:DNA-binding transcriptional MerR regulator